jgi:hypothetical protein
MNHALIKNNIQGWKVLILFIVTNLVYAYMLIISIPKTMTYSNGMKLLDMMPTGYDAEYVSTLFSTLGEKGREVYLYNQIPIDMIYPLLFGISFSLLMAFFLNKLNKLDTSLIYLSLLPLIAGVCDYMENIGIIILLKSFPDLPGISVKITNIFSLGKSTLTTLYFISLLIILIVLGIKTISKKKTSVNNL